MALYRLIASFVVLAFMMAATALMAAGWLAVILVGLLHPQLSPRRACDWSPRFHPRIGRPCPGARSEPTRVSGKLS